MQNLDPQEIEDRVSQLPAELGILLDSEATAEHCDILASKYLLTSEQKDVLLEEVALVLLKYTSIGSLADRLAQQVRIPQSRAVALAAEIDREILGPVHNLLITVAPTVERAVAPEESAETFLNTSLTDHVAQFQERKRQREDELKKQQGVSAQNSTIPPANFTQ